MSNQRIDFGVGFFLFKPGSDPSHTPDFSRALEEIPTPEDLAASKERMRLYGIRAEQMGASWPVMSRFRKWKMDLYKKTVRWLHRMLIGGRFHW